MKGNVAGFFAAQFFKVYNNRSYGTIADPTTPGTNVTSHAHLVDGVVTAQLPEIAFERAIFKGGGQYLGSMFIGVGEVPEIPLEFSDIDDTLVILAGGGLADTTTVSGLEVSSNNDLNPDPNRIGMMLTTKFHSRASGSDGEFAYLTYFLMGQLRLQNPQLSHAGGENTGMVRGTFTPQLMSKFPNGQAFGANQGWYKNKAAIYRIKSDKPLAMTTYIADGSATAFTTAYKPALSTVTSGNTNNWYTKAGVNTAPTSHSTSTGVVTIAAAGTTGDYHNAIYQVGSDFPVP